MVLLRLNIVGELMKLTRLKLQVTCKAVPLMIDVDTGSSYNVFRIRMYYEEQGGTSASRIDYRQRLRQCRALYVSAVADDAFRQEECPACEGFEAGRVVRRPSHDDSLSRPVGVPDVSRDGDQPRKRADSEDLLW